MLNSIHRVTDIIETAYTIKNIVSRYIISINQQKIDFIKNKYKLSDTDMALVLKVDNTDKGSYIDWVAKQYKNKNIRLPEDNDILTNSLEIFDKLKTKRFFNDNKDINQYKAPGDLYEVLDKYKDRKEDSNEVVKREEKALGGYTVVVKKDDFTWYKVTTATAASYLGSGTSWCTVPNETTANSYLGKGPLYILYKDGQPAAQVHFPTEQFMDKFDRDFVEEIFINVLINVSSYIKELQALLAEENPNNYVIGTYDDADKDLAATNYKFAFDYAYQILEGRFPEGEPAIAKDGRTSYEYAKEVLHDRFPAGEPTIALSGSLSIDYARHVIHGRFIEAEDLIAINPDLSIGYAEVLKTRFPKGESAIAQSSWSSYVYALKIIKGRWTKGEPAIISGCMEGDISDIKVAVLYAVNVLKSRWRRIEEQVFDSDFSAMYKKGLKDLGITI